MNTVLGDGRSQPHRNPGCGDKREAVVETDKYGIPKGSSQTVAMGNHWLESGMLRFLGVCRTLV